MGVARVPLSEIKAYLDIFPDPDPMMFIQIMLAMDSAYIGHYGEIKPKSLNKDNS